MLYFDKTCTISSVTYSKVGGSEKRVSTPIYTDIECNFEVKVSQFKDSELGRNTDEGKYIVVLPIDRNLIRNNYVVELIDPDIGSQGSYIIANVQPYRSLSGGIDCITFTAKEIEGQL